MQRISKNNYILIMNDHKYDSILAQEISDLKMEKPYLDLIVLTKGNNNSIQYIKPFFYITYCEEEDLEQLYREVDILKNTVTHKQYIDLISESLAYNLIQGTNLSLMEKHITVLGIEAVSGGCIMLENHLLSEAKMIQMQLYLFVTKSIFCLFHQHKKNCIVFLFSKLHLDVSDSQEIAFFLHSLGIEKKDVGVSGVKYNLAQFHDAYLESMLDFENDFAYTISLQDNAIDYRLSLISEKMIRSLEERNVESLNRNIEEYIEFLFQLKSIYRVEVTIQLLHHLYERFYLIKNNQPIRKMIKEIESDNILSTELDTIYNILQTVLTKMMSMMSEKTIMGNALINEIYEYVKVNYRQPLCLKEVADVFHVTPQYVCRLFAKHTSTNFTALLTYFRIYHAKMLLKSGFTIKEVANVCGFHDVGYFMKKFKSVTGLTASEFRNNNIKYQDDTGYK